MKKLHLPKTGVSYYSTTLNDYVTCGEILPTTLSTIKPDPSIGWSPFVIREQDINMIDISRPLNKYKDGAQGFLLKLNYKSNNSIPTNTTLTFNVGSGSSINVRITSNVPANQPIIVYGVVYIKQNLPTSITLTIGEIENVTVPVNVVDAPNITGSNRTSKLPLFYSSDESNLYASSTTVFTDVALIDTDKTFCVWDIKPLRGGSVFTGPQSLILGFDEKTKKSYELSLGNIHSAYIAAGGTRSFTNLTYRFRGFNLRLNTGKPNTVELPSDQIKLNYDVGLVTNVKDFVISEDGYTISGRFNSKCVIEHQFNTDLPLLINTDADGSFEYTYSKSYLAGGILRLTPSNRAGVYRASTLTLADRLAPNPINDITITTNGLYGVAEIGSTVKLYNDDMEFIGQTTAPVTGLVIILFNEPIDGTVEEKDFVYTIEDASGNISLPIVVTYVRQNETFSGSINSMMPEQITVDVSINTVTLVNEG